MIRYLLAVVRALLMVPISGRKGWVLFFQLMLNTVVAILVGLAVANVVPSVSNDVLWYHADYVAPTWRRSLQAAQSVLEMARVDKLFQVFRQADRGF